MALKDYPDMKAVFDKLQAEKAEILARSKEYRDEYNAIVEEMAPLEARRREVSRKFRAIEQPRVAEIDNALGVIARGTGGYSTSQATEAPAEPPAEPPTEEQAPSS